MEQKKKAKQKLKFDTDEKGILNIFDHKYYVLHPDMLWHIRKLKMSESNSK